MPSNPGPIDRSSERRRIIQRLKENGIDDGGVLDLAAECVFASLVGVVDNLAGQVELDEFLQPFAWKG